MVSFQLIQLDRNNFYLGFFRSYFDGHESKIEKETDFEEEKALENSKAVVFRTQSRGKDSKERGEVIAFPQWRSFESRFWLKNIKKN